MVKQMSYVAIAKVIDSWELARQKHGSDEELGNMILLNMFRLNPTIKEVFGFQAKQNVETNPLLRMGVLVHAARIMQMLDCVISLLGPDIDTLEEVLSQLGERHAKQGVKKEHFAVMGEAVCKSLKEILGDDFTSEASDVWRDMFDDMAETIVTTM